MTQCTNCGATLDPGAAVCPSCGTPAAASEAPAASTAIPEAPAAAAAMPEAPAASPAPHIAAATPAATTSTSNLMNFARGAKGLALLCFLLPWVTVSCAGQTLVSITGANLATGSIPAPGGPAAQMGGGAPNAAAQTGSHSPNILVLLAAILIVAALVVTFVMPRRRAALLAMIGSGVAAVLIAFTVLVSIKGAVDNQIRESNGGAATPPAGGGGELDAQMRQSMEQMTQAISVDPALGFWLTILALIAAVVINKMIHGREGAAGPRL
jgi:hypothetical protein